MLLGLELAGSDAISITLAIVVVGAALAVQRWVHRLELRLQRLETKAETRPGSGVYRSADQ